jgi:adenine-specific DNA-methyltransferase
MELRKGTRRARQLRLSATDAECRLWTHLRSRRLRQLKFRRQLPIAGYIVDFVCLETRLVVELDGGQHAEQSTHDEHRTAILEKNGFRVLRFWNDDVLTKLDAVLEEILGSRKRHPHPNTLPPAGEGAKTRR